MLIRRGLHLRVESGLLSGIDLAADDPGTKMMVNVLASVLEFQRDMISENTRQGVAAAEASGKTLGRPTALAPDKAAEIVTAYSEGAAVKALAREHHVAPKTIRLTVPLELHHAALQQSAALAAEGAGQAERKAYRVYAARITAAKAPQA
ncbi:Resolvase, N terminal domain [Sinosporangium album]|uniref:Resolvase, N terminal domain n=2 Tax=Sinosporangium album TaxID=504805 RepID=A0A1G8KIW0_9ACTN|nr:Resolvase, N terminal domain [Sinosporangium album]